LKVLAIGTGALLLGESDLKGLFEWFLSGETLTKLTADLANLYGDADL
jgi:hypothetical protein